MKSHPRACSFLFLFLLSAGLLCAQRQSDHPVADDFADRRQAGEDNLKRQLKTIDDIVQALHQFTANHPESLKSQGAYVQVRMMRCLANGDYQRLLATIYGDAAASATQMAEEFEAHNKTEAPSESLNKLAQELEEARRREAELSASQNPMDASELTTLRIMIGQMEEAQDLAKKRPTYAGDPAQASRMREIASQSATLAKTANDDAERFNQTCLIERDILAQLVREEKNEALFDTWKSFLDKTSKPSPTGSVRQTPRILVEGTVQIKSPQEEIKSGPARMDISRILQEQTNAPNGVITSAPNL